MADGESTLSFACPGGLVPGTACDDGVACTDNDVVTAECTCAGVVQDTDNDGTCDADDCPNDPLKTTPGECGCGVSDVLQDYYVDADGDGYGAGVAIPGFICDPPANTVTNNTDACPADPDKQAAGVCGCGNADTDTDADGAADCIDACPLDPLKTNAGTCGCGVADTDTDGDGIADCNDSCPNIPERWMAQPTWMIATPVWAEQRVLLLACWTATEILVDRHYLTTAACALAVTPASLRVRPTAMAISAALP